MIGVKAEVSLPRLVAWRHVVRTSRVALVLHVARAELSAEGPARAPHLSRPLLCCKLPSYFRSSRLSSKPKKMHQMHERGFEKLHRRRKTSPKRCKQAGLEVGTASRGRARDLVYSHVAHGGEPMSRIGAWVRRPQGQGESCNNDPAKRRSFPDMNDSGRLGEGATRE